MAKQRDRNEPAHVMPAHVVAKDGEGAAACRRARDILGIGGFKTGAPAAEPSLREAVA